MSVNESRREFLKKSSMLIGTTALFGGAAMLAGCGAKPAEKPAEPSSEAAPAPAAPTSTEIPTHPYQSIEFDIERAKKDAFDGFWNGACCYGVANALITQLREKVGHPFTCVPPEMFKVGEGGFGTGTLCGALGGAVMMIGMLCPRDDANVLIKKLFRWYTSTAIPGYQPNMELPTSVAPSVNCVDSLGNFKRTSGITEQDKVYNRCAGLTGDVAAKTAELLNVYFGYMEAPEEVKITEKDLGPNEYLGVGHGGFGGDVTVKVTMDGSKIAKVDILESEETMSKQCNEVISQIVAKNSADVEGVVGSTMSSHAIMAAVADALSKVSM